MNHIKRLFHELKETFDNDASDQRVEVLAADIAARVASQGITCVGLASSGWDISHNLMVYLYTQWGLVLRGRVQSLGYTFAYIDQEAEQPAHEYAGNTYMVRYATEARAEQEVVRMSA